MSLMNKLRKLILLPFRKLSYGSFSTHSDIIAPMMIEGKKNIFLGNHSLIRNYARIEAIKEYRNQKFNPKLVIGDNVLIEQGVHLTCATELVIGDNTTISSNVYISDCSHSYDQVSVNVLDQPLKTGSVSIGKYCFIGTGAKILPGVTIGDGCIIGANAVVTHSIPGNSVAAGIPARIIKQYDEVQKAWVSAHK